MSNVAKQLHMKLAPELRGAVSIADIQEAIDREYPNQINVRLLAAEILKTEYEDARSALRQDRARRAAVDGVSFEMFMDKLVSVTPYSPNRVFVAALHAYEDELIEEGWERDADWDSVARANERADFTL
jgi:hypothetical protein